MIGRLFTLLAKLTGFRRQDAPEPPIVEGKVPAQRRHSLIAVPRFDGISDPPPFSWKPCHPSTMRRFKAQMTCPRGHGLVLKGHSIDATGQVHPSVVCMADGCDFHEFVRLADWDFGTLV